jgi:hypothetical protein
LEAADGEAVQLRARNISASGIYLDADRRLAEFTEVSLVVRLPAVGNLPAAQFQCAGVIVRVEERAEGAAWPFGVAVHFTGITDLHRTAIIAYVEAVLARAAAANGPPAAGSPAQRD